jgi:DNA-binding transcriptional ArsR family regulator
MNPSDAAAALDALGSVARLEAYRALVRAGRSGLAIGRLQERLDGIPRSTLAHHLNKLLQAGLIAQERSGTSVICRTDYARMDALLAFLTAECCVDERRPIALQVSQ